MWLLYWNEPQTDHMVRLILLNSICWRILCNLSEGVSTWHWFHALYWIWLQKHWDYLRQTAFQYKDQLPRYRDSLHKDKEVMRQSYFYNGNPYTGKSIFILIDYITLRQSNTWEPFAVMNVYSICIWICLKMCQGHIFIIIWMQLWQEKRGNIINCYQKQNFIDIDPEVWSSIPYVAWISCPCQLS